MLDLYHWEPNGACARVLICLKEKGVEFASHRVDLLAFEQYRPAFLELNGSGMVPVLVRDGRPYNEAAYICEMLEEAHPQLMPPDPRGRWEVRAWQKYVDDFVDASVSEIAWQTYGLPALRSRDRAAIEAEVGRIPVHERRDLWNAALQGFSEEQLTRSRGRIRDAVARIESDLARGQWLVGGAYSLADIAAFAFVNYLPRMLPEVVSASAAPRTLAWLQRMRERPAVKAALAMAGVPDPYAVAAPGAEQVRWG